MKIVFLSIMFSALYSADSQASSEFILLSCKEKHSTLTVIETKAKGFTLSNSSKSPKEPSQAMFKFYPDKLVLIGNADTVTLIKLSENNFIEKTGSGNIVKWTFLGSLVKDTQKVYIAQQKAYEIRGLIGPTAGQTLWECVNARASK